MNPVSEALLLTMAQIAATLIGLLLVGVFFYLETGFRRLAHTAPRVGPFVRAYTCLVLLLYALVLGLSLGLVALAPVWVTVLFVLLGIATVAALVELTRRTRELPRAVRRRNGATWAAWPPVVVTLALPWVSGLPPSREALTGTMFLAGALAFSFTLGLLLSTFDLSVSEQAEQAAPARASGPGSRKPSAVAGSGAPPAAG